MARRHWIGSCAVLLLGCSHSDAFTYGTPNVGPASTGADVQLTFNADQDYWPIWTEDGRGLLYAYVDGGATFAHRCVGLLPPAGGTRIWEMCDNRANQADSTSGFPGFALGSDGRLIYTEAVAFNSGGALSTATLWLADSAKPFARTALLTLPAIVGGINYTSLGDIQWTGANTFIALAQLVETFPHCHACGSYDTLLTDRGVVVIGTIAAQRASLAAIAGTTRATGYSLAENGASVVFTRANDTHLFKTPIAGGIEESVVDVSPGQPAQLLGVSCKGSTCVVAADPLTLTDPSGPTFPSVNPGTHGLYAIGLATHTVQLVASSPDAIFASPQYSPLNGDVAVQIGGVWGHLQTNAGSTSDLHLYRGLLP